MIELFDSGQVIRARAFNDSVFTLGGTNTWLVGGNGAQDALLIDPGPDSPDHMAQIMHTLQSQQITVQHVVLTHAHDDHIGNLWRTISRLPGITVHCLFHGYDEQIPTSHGTYSIVATPGHTYDSISVWEQRRGYLFTGDTVLGTGPTMIDYPDGSLSDYLTSLNALTELEVIEHIFPGHGDVVSDPYGKLRKDFEHRNARIAQVEEASRTIGTDPVRLTDALYDGVSDELRGAALQNTMAALEYLGLHTKDLTFVGVGQ